MAEFNDTFLKACRREPVSHVPVWYMRQAGRYQPEYRAIKANKSLMDIVAAPELCAQVTRLPVEQLGVDAAILFSDIMTPVGAMGVPFEIREGIGPCIDTPIRTTADIARLRVPDFADTIGCVGETIGLLRDSLHVPLIGFCGAPYTLACYLVEGGPTKHYAKVKGLMYGQPDAWHALMEVLTDGMIAYLCYQAESGAQAVQVFDSWIGTLGTADYINMVQPHMKRLFATVRERTDIPLLHFGVNTAHLLECLRDAGGDVIGIDWRTDMQVARRRLGDTVALQGNLDPGVLLGPWELVAQRATEVLAAGRGPGQIFNLGHGVLPQTPVASLQRLTALVHAQSQTADA